MSFYIQAPHHPTCHLNDLIFFNYVRILTMKELFKREKLYQTIEMFKTQP